jgi:hypothetical protein
VKILLLVIAVAILLTPAICASGSATQFRTAEITIQVNEKKSNGNDWDSLSKYAGGNPAPDVFGKIEFEKGSCDIEDNEDNEDSYIVYIECEIDYSVGQRAYVQIFDADSMRVDDEIGIGYIDIDSNPTVKTVGSLEISIKGKRGLF